MVCREPTTRQLKVMPKLCGVDGSSKTLPLKEFAGSGAIPSPLTVPFRSTVEKITKSPVHVDNSCFASLAIDVTWQVSRNSGLRKKNMAGGHFSRR
jgi:hypothetical protein